MPHDVTRHVQHSLLFHQLLNWCAVGSERFGQPCPCERGPPRDRTFLPGGARGLSDNTARPLPSRRFRPSPWDRGFLTYRPPDPLKNSNVFRQYCALESPGENYYIYVREGRSGNTAVPRDSGVTGTQGKRAPQRSAAQSAFMAKDSKVINPARVRQTCSTARLLKTAPRRLRALS